jgi:nitrogen-specific signal transduction histidine kinase
MAAKPARAAILSDLSSRCFEHAPAPMVTVEGATHIVRYANPAFCRLTDKSNTELVGTPFCGMLPETDECLMLLDRVHRTGIPESYTKLRLADSEPALSSYMMWPVMGDERRQGRRDPGGRDRAAARKNAGDERGADARFAAPA